jgi:hypothetical protein
MLFDTLFLAALPMHVKRVSSLGGFRPIAAGLERWRVGHG